MSHTFHAFIDESGDEGLGEGFREPGESGGSSRWFVISALVYRSIYSVESVKWRDEIKNGLGRKPTSKRKTLHFKDLNHGQKLYATRVLSQKPVRCISVISAKETIPRAVYNEKNQLYFYMTRYLIERLSWLVRRSRREVSEGNGQVKITFSRRGGMQYDAFRSYLQHLKKTRKDTSIHWPSIDIDAVDAEDHSKLASLQLADLVASSFSAGFELDFYGNCESRYAENLKPVTYHHKKRHLSYGVKLMPNLDSCPLMEQHEPMVALWR